jgi:hypothetical protein
LPQETRAPYLRTANQELKVVQRGAEHAEILYGGQGRFCISAVNTLHPQFERCRRQFEVVFSRRRGRDRAPEGAAIEHQSRIPTVELNCDRRLPTLHVDGQLRYLFDCAIRAQRRGCRGCHAYRDQREDSLPS